MPHALLKDFKSFLPEMVAISVGELKAFVFAYADMELYKIITRLKESCPPPKTTKALIEKLDSINNLMNKTDKKIKGFKKIPDVLIPVMVAGKVVVEIISHLALPSTIGTPPGPQGGVIVSVPVGKITSASNRLVWCRKMVETIEEDILAINNLIKQAEGMFDPVRMQLDRAIGLLQRCLENPDMSVEERKAILDGIQGVNTSKGMRGKDRTDYKKDGGVPYTSSGGYVYKLSVINEINPQSIIPRRQAIAKDYRDIIVMKGPLSFASSEEVLLDEIKFRIDNQLP